MTSSLNAAGSLCTWVMAPPGGGGPTGGRGDGAAEAATDGTRWLLGDSVVDAGGGPGSEDLRVGTSIGDDQVELGQGGDLQQGQPAELGVVDEQVLLGGGVEHLAFEGHDLLL